MNSDLKITLSRVLEKPLQINGTDTETHYINELFKRLVFHELLNKLNLKDLYHYRDNVKYCPGKVELNFTLNKQELDLLINQITSMDNVQKTYTILQSKLQDLNKGEQEELIQKTMKEIFETLRKQIKGDFDQNNIIIILDNSISLTCKKHPIPGTNNSIFIIQPYLIDTIEKIGIQSINMYEQYQIIAVYQNQIPYLDLLIQVQWIKISLNLKWYFTGMFIQQKLSKLNEDIVRHETITGKPLTKEYIRFFNEPKKQYELTIKNYLQWKI